MKISAGLWMAFVVSCKPIAGAGDDLAAPAPLAVVEAPTEIETEADAEAAPVANDDRLKETIAARRSEVFGCYDKRHREDPTLKGDVLITWTVAPDGTSTVSFAADIDEVLSGSRREGDRRLVDDPALQACVAALALRFPVDDKPQRKRSVPFSFGVPALAKPVVLAAEGIAVADAGRGMSILTHFTRPCRPLLAAGETVVIDWQRHDGTDAIVGVSGGDAVVACVVGRLKAWKAFPKLATGSVRIQVFAPASNPQPTSPG